MQETDQRDQKQQERKQRKQHLVGQCRCIGGHLVIEELVDGSHQHLADFQFTQMGENHGASSRSLTGKPYILKTGMS